MTKTISNSDIANLLKTPAARKAYALGFWESLVMSGAAELDLLLEAWLDDIEGVEHPKMLRLQEALKALKAKAADGKVKYTGYKLSEPRLIEFACDGDFSAETASSLWRFLVNDQRLAEFMATHDFKGVMNDDGTVSMSRLRKLAKLITSENWKTRGFGGAMRDLLTAVTAL